MIATTGGMSNNLGGFSDGLLFSENYGQNWICINVPNVDWSNHDLESSKTTIVRFNPFDSNQLVLGGHRSIWFSDDLGQSWQTVNAWDTNLNTEGYIFDPAEDWYVSDIEFHPINVGEVYASTTVFDGQELAMILKSTDGGQTWSVLENNNGRLPNPAQIGSVRIDFTPADPGALYCMHNIPGNNAIQLSKSYDGGSTWELLDERVTGFNEWNSYKSEFEMSDNRFHMAYYGARFFKVLRETDGIWSSLGLNGNLHADIRDIKIFNADGTSEFLLLGTDGGISSGLLNSENIANGDPFTWNSLNGEGLLLTQIYGGGSWNADSRGIYGTQDNGTFTYANTFSSFENAGQGDGSFAEVSKYFDGQGIRGNQGARSCFLDYNASSSPFASGEIPSTARTLRIRQFYNPQDETRVSIAVKDFFLYQFDPFTCSSSEIPIQKAGLDPSEINNDIAAHCVAPSNSDIIYIFYEGTYWATIQDMFENPELHPSTVEPDPLDPLEPFKLKNRVFRSLDGGETFNDISNDFVIDGYYPYQYNEPKFVTVDPRDPLHVYVGMKRFNVSDDPRLVNIYESYDGGLSWQTKADGMDRHGIQSLYYVDGSDEMIFAATDAGVYVWSNNQSEWHSINGNLPPCIVADLDYDYCTRVLTAYTYGKGIWTIQIPEHNFDYIIQEDLFISPFEQHVFENDVIVKSGATLTVTGELFFKDHGRLIVETGGKLIVDGGLLSSKCGDLWQGVEVHGDDQLSQTPFSNQGHVVLKNGAVIEHAHTGIWVQRNDDNCNLVAGTGGGIVHASDSEIRNCYVGVEFAEYKYLNPQEQPISNKSYFNNMAFIQNEVLLNNDVFKAHVRLIEVFGIRFRGCSFIDVLPDQSAYQSYYALGYKKMGIGIDSHSSTFSVTQYCTTALDPNGGCQGTLIDSYFEGLEIGIASTDSYGDRNFRVSNSIFTGNIIGVYSSGQVMGSVITENNFIMHPVLAGVELDGDLANIIGTVVSSSIGFEIEENTYTGNPPLGNGDPDQTLVGAAFINNGTYPNECYKNTFDRLNIGIHVQDNNGGEDGNGVLTGLQLKCNQFGAMEESNGIDIHLPDNSSMAPAQGTVEAAARNEFSHLDGCIGLDVDSDILVSQINTLPFSYFFTGGVDGNDITNLEKPICFTESKVADAHNVINTQTCQSDLSYTQVPSQLLDLRSSKEEVLDDVILLYNEKLDKGNPKVLADFIKDANNSSIEVRNEMISCVPYISDAAWKLAFTRQPAMNEWHLAQVLLESSPLKKTVIQMMDTYNLGSFYKELVLNGQNGGLTHLMILESELSEYSVSRYKAQQDFAKNNSIFDEEVLDYTTLTTNLNPDYSLSDALLYSALKLTTNNIPEVQSQMIKDTPEDNSFEVMNILIDAKNNTDKCEKFSPDQINALNTIAAKDVVNGHARAGAALRQQLDNEIDIELRFAIDSKSLKTSLPVSTPIFSIYPNPAKDQAFITTNIPDGVSKASIEVINIQGSIVSNISNIDPVNIIELSIESLPVGIYVCKMYFDGIEVQSEKLVIIR